MTIQNQNIVKLTTAEEGQVTIPQTTVFSKLLLIGAMRYGRTYNGDSERYDYPTDTAGLERLESMTSEAVQLVSRMINSLGMVLAHTDTKALTEVEQGSYAWLVAGLGDLLVELTDESEEMRHTLRLTEET